MVWSRGVPPKGSGRGLRREAAWWRVATGLLIASLLIHFVWIGDRGGRLNERPSGGAPRERRGTAQQSQRSACACAASWWRRCHNGRALPRGPLEHSLEITLRSFPWLLPSRPSNQVAQRHWRHLGGWRQPGACATFWNVGSVPCWCLTTKPAYLVYRRYRLNSMQSDQSYVGYRRS